MSRIDNKNYIVIQGWMVNELNLKGNELLIFGVINGFSQAEDQRYTGSLQYLSEWTGATKQTVINSLKSLLEKGFIDKEEKFINGVKFVEYWSKNLNGGGQKILLGGSQKIRPNNIDINNIKDNIYTTPTKKFIKPSLEEIKSYCQERHNNINPEAFYDFYEANGWVQGKAGKPIKNWKACMRTWEKNNFQSNKKNQSVPDYMTFDYEDSKDAPSLDETFAMLEKMKS